MYSNITLASSLVGFVIFKLLGLFITSLESVFVFSGGSQCPAPIIVDVLAMDCPRWTG